MPKLRKLPGPGKQQTNPPGHFQMQTVRDQPQDQTQERIHARPQSEIPNRKPPKSSKDCRHPERPGRTRTRKKTHLENIPTKRKTQ
ncbi:hypothetical protein D6783_03205 [Candidatus Woesearchaeota archaeon]|nr:MAG: hypothetical protein D6783_03205 [Candidatus Woesearchaeota archaeon]